MGMIYLDGHATTPLAPEAAAAITDAWSAPGNPGSPHAAGARAAKIVEVGRAAVAKLVGAAPSELCFTSGATEANNIVLLGVARAARTSGSKRDRVLMTPIEHKSVLACADALRSEGFEVGWTKVGPDGLVDLNNLALLLDERTLLLSIGGANGEIGAVQPVAEAAALGHRAGALVHSDLAQMTGKLPLDVIDLELDYASFSAHKIYGPVGIGALYVAAGALAPTPLVFGGGQEGGLRSGTISHPLVAGFGAAAEVAGHRLADDALHSQELAHIFLRALDQRQVRWRLNGSEQHRLPGSINIQLIGVDAENIVERLSQSLAISTGSACQSGQIASSHVLQEIGLMHEQQRSSARMYFSRYNTTDDAHRAAELMASAVRAESLATGGLVQ